MASGTIRCFISRRFERRLPNLVPKKRRITVTGARRFANFWNGATTPQKVDAGDRKHSSSPAARKAQNGVLAVILIISWLVYQRDNHEYAKGRAMEESSRSNYQPDCPLAHDLINKLAVIVGQCDLLVEKTPKDSPLFKQTLLCETWRKRWDRNSANCNAIWLVCERQMALTRRRH